MYVLYVCIHLFINLSDICYTLAPATDISVIAFICLWLPMCYMFKYSWVFGLFYVVWRNCYCGSIKSYSNWSPILWNISILMEVVFPRITVPLSTIVWWVCKKYQSYAMTFTVARSQFSWTAIRDFFTDMLDNTLHHHHHQNTSWGDIFWKNAHPSSTLSETYRKYAKVYWSWLLVVAHHLNNTLMLVLTLINHPSAYAYSCIVHEVHAEATEEFVV